MPTAESNAFDAAITASKKLKQTPTHDELLQLYALFKVGNREDIKSSPTPGMFDLKGKAKRKAWQATVDEGTTHEQAQEKYAALVESLKEKYGYET